MKKKLTEKEWCEIQTVWESGTSTPKQISEDYNINRTTLRNKASVNKWKRRASVIPTAVKKARKKFTVKTKDSFKKTAEKMNKRHADIFREIQDLGRVYYSLFRQELTYAINEDNAELEKIQEVIKKIKLKKQGYLACAIANMQKEGIRGERKVMGLDNMNFENQDNNLDQLVEAIDRARRERGIIDVPVG